MNHVSPLTLNLTHDHPSSMLMLAIIDPVVYPSANLPTMNLYLHVVAPDIEKNLANEEASKTADRIEQERFAEETRLEVERVNQEKLTAEEAEKQPELDIILSSEEAARRTKSERIEQDRLLEEAQLESEKTEQERVAAEEAELQAESETMKQKRLGAEAREARVETDTDKTPMAVAGVSPFQALRQKWLAAESETGKTKQESLPARKFGRRAKLETIERERLDAKTEEARLQGEAQSESVWTKRLVPVAGASRIQADRQETRLAELERICQGRLAGEARHEGKKIEQVGLHGKEAKRKAALEKFNQDRREGEAEEARLAAERTKRLLAAVSLTRLRTKREECGQPAAAVF